MKEERELVLTASPPLAGVSLSADNAGAAASVATAPVSLLANRTPFCMSLSVCMVAELCRLGDLRVLLDSWKCCNCVNCGNW